MQILNTKIKKNLLLFFFSILLFNLNAVWAESDMQLQEKALKARELMHQQEIDHSNHKKELDDSEIFRGVFYAYLPCNDKDCDGLKMTLSLKQKNNYLLVSQYAKASSRENYEKGKYTWDDVTHKLSLTPNKEDAVKRQFTIKDDSTFTQLNSNGTAMAGDQEAYTFRRSDKAKSREVHIH